MPATIIVPNDFSVEAAMDLAKDNNTPLWINPDTQQNLICDVQLRGFVLVYDPTHHRKMKRRVEDVYLMTCSPGEPGGCGGAVSAAELRGSGGGKSPSSFHADSEGGEL